MKTALILAALFLAGCNGCVEEQRSIEILRKNGFTHIQMTGYEYFGCGHGDMYHTGFIATSASGETVKGLVCCGWTKGCTIRFE